MRSFTLSFGLVLAVLGLVSNAGAAADGVAVAPPGGGQPALAVGFDPSGDLRAKVCPTAECDPSGGERVETPAEVKDQKTSARLEVRRIGRDRKAVVVRIPARSGEREYVAIVAAEPGRSEPKIVFAGWTGLTDGIEGERRGAMVVTQGRGIYVGEQQENRTLCGRPAILSPRVLYYEDLSLHPAKLQRLDAVERERAPRLEATLAQTPRAAGLLRAIWASSAATGHLPGALTDGDRATAWVENRGGEGRGELAVMNAPRDLPLAGFEVTLVPETEGAERFVAPEVFWIATRAELYRVAVPEEASRQPGAVLSVQLPAPIETDCVAVVIERARSVDKDAQVAFSEVAAVTALDFADVPKLVEALGRGGAGATEAAAALRFGGPEALGAVAAAFGSLGEQGRRLALDILDHAPCETAIGPYVQALTSSSVAHQRAARGRLARCKALAGPALADALEGSAVEARPRLLAALARIDPETTVRRLTLRLDTADPVTRREYRQALSRAAADPAAVRAIEEALESPDLETVAQIDLLRALGRRAAAYAPARALFARLATGTPSFRTRYLLLDVAASLTEKDESARQFLRRALARDESRYIRARAASVIEDAGPYRVELMRSLHDPDVRVRAAAATTLGEARADFASHALIERLDEDPWPLVREESAHALAALGPSVAVDEALVDALSDGAPSVRRRVLLALGQRHALDRAGDVRERLEDGDEPASVRSAAATALGKMCDSASIGVLTEYARALADPKADATARTIGRSAVGALGRLHPADLKERLSPLLARGVSSLTQQAARDALAARASCGRAREKS